VQESGQATGRTRLTGPTAILRPVTDQRIEKWRGWIDDGQIQHEVLTMYLNRETFQRVQAIIRHNGRLPDSYWWRFMGNTYGMAQAAAIRRQVYADKDSASLGKLVSEISEDAAKLTREFWLDCPTPTSDEGELAERDRAWRDLYAGQAGGHLDPAIPIADLAALRAGSTKVIRWVDRHVAHSDTRPIAAADVPTLADIHEVIGLIGLFFEKYTHLLTGKSWGRLTTPIPYDWEAVFRVPWMRGSGPPS
jgi:hypothetical protein